MKKRLSLLLSIVFLFGFFSLSSCMKESSENLAYTITGDTCTITGIGKNKSRKIVIPSEIEGKAVTTIATQTLNNQRQTDYGATSFQAKLLKIAKEKIFIILLRLQN